MSKNLSAVVVAAGQSRRFNEGGAATSKQLIEWGGKPLIVHTLSALQTLSLSEMALVIRPEEEAAMHEHLKSFKAECSLKIVFGGRLRQDSVRNGLKALNACERVFIHDGARPFLSREFLEGLDEKSKTCEAVIPVLNIVDTLKEIDSNGRVVKTHNRKSFVRVQTPQFFKYESIMSAHEKLKDTGIEYTDDAAMIEACGGTVETYLGSSENIKVTLPEDLKRLGIHVG